MKSKKRVGVFLFVTAGILALSFIAAAQEKKPQLFFIEDYVVKPSMVPQFEAALKGFTKELFQPYAWPWPMDTYATEDFHYYCLYPFESLTEIDKGFATFGEMLGKFGGEKYDILNRKLGDATEYYRQGTVTFNPELSYTPEIPRIKPEEAKFVYWGFCYVMPGKEKEFEALFKKIVALFESKKIDQGFKSWTGGLGTEMPFYFYSETGKSPADFFLTDEKVMKLVDPDITNIWNTVLGLMRKYEGKMGSYRPDLSYTPAAKAK
jgi:hypothetical protein